MKTNMFTDANALLDQALNTWAAMSEERGGTLGSWFLQMKADALNEARTHDPSGLTAYMLLRDTFRTQMRDRTVTLWQCIDDLPGVEAALAKHHALWDLLNDSSVLAEMESFRAGVLAGCAHYGLEPDEDFLSWLSESGLSNLRASALRSMERLEVHQFAQGAGAEGPLRYNTMILEFWNVNSLLRAARYQMTDGITLVLVRDPVALHSFFVVAIKNGENITLLTDRSKDPHPDYKRMARRLDRDLESRWNANWFPYELLDVASTDDNKRLYAKARTGLVPIQAQAVAIRPMKDVHPASLVWLMLLFDRIQDRFGGVAPLRLEKVSYTGEMVREPHALVDAESALVREGRYEPLELPRLTHEAMRNPGEAAGYLRPATGFNDWMIERYGPQVPEQVFNLVGEREVAGLLPDLEQGELAARENKRRDWDPESGTHHHLELGAVEPLDFGTAEHIAKNRVWNARKSQCAVIQRLAERDFLNERANVMDWFTTRVRDQADVLLNALAAGEFVAPDHGSRCGQRDLFALDVAWRDRIVKRNVLRVAEHSNHCWFKDDRCEPEALGNEPVVRLGEHTGWPSYRWLCPDTEAQATIFGLLNVNCPQGIAALCGVPVEELPWPLHHWFTNEPYYGNDILDRLDHQDSKLKNPWLPRHGAVGVEGKYQDGLNLRVGMALSRRAITARRRNLGLDPKVQPWTPEKVSRRR